MEPCNNFQFTFGSSIRNGWVFYHHTIALKSSRKFVHLILVTSHFKSSTLVIPLLFVFWSIVWIAFFCELGEMVTNHFKIFNDELWQCDWYSCPVEIQRMLIIVIANTKQPMIIRGYARALCTREALKDVIFIWNYSVWHTLY